MSPQKPRSERTLEELGIDLTPIPEPPPPPPRRSTGRQSKLGILFFLYRLFEYNELSPRECRLTDYAIMLKLKAEYPGRRSLNKMKLGKMRYRYNSGSLLSKQNRPHRIALRYDNDGSPIDSKTRRPLPPETIREWCFKFGIPDNRYLNAKEIKEMQRA